MRRPQVGRPGRVSALWRSAITRMLNAPGLETAAARARAPRSRSANIAAVGIHGLERRRRLAMCAVLISLLFFTAARAQVAGPFADLLPELAGQLVAVLPPGAPASLSVALPEAVDQSEPIRFALVTLLTARGVRFVNAADGIASVNVSCAINLRDRACLAEVRADGRDVLATAVRPRDEGAADDRALQPALALRPIFSQRVQMLDVAALDPDVNRLVVLDRAGVTLHQRGDDGWHALESSPLPARVWPRDLRGRLLIDNGRFGVLLPGTVCNGRFGPLNIACTEQKVPWAFLGIANAGLEPDRNYFTTPEGLMFYGAAPFFPGNVQWSVVADRRGTLTMLDANRRPIADVGAADDVIPLRSVCAPGRFYVSASHQPAGSDVLRAFALDGSRLVQAAPDLPLPGTFTALRSTDALIALVITRLDNAERYDAFQASITCGR